MGLMGHCFVRYCQNKKILYIYTVVEIWRSAGSARKTLARLKVGCPYSPYDP